MKITKNINLSRELILEELGTVISESKTIQEIFGASARTVTFSATFPHNPYDVRDNSLLAGVRGVLVEGTIECGKRTAISAELDWSDVRKIVKEFLGCENVIMSPKYEPPNGDSTKYKRIVGLACQGHSNTCT